MRVIGLMSGTSLDGVDAAWLETDGEAIARFGPVAGRAYSAAERAVLKAAVEAALVWRFEGPEPAVFAQAAQLLTASHAEAVRAILDQGVSADLIGFHGQTVLHEAPQNGALGRTRQLADGSALAAATGIDVIYDFRTADMAAGGQGAPFAPLYHRALAAWSGLERPLGVLNLGGVANLTLIAADGSLRAFDTGPASGLMDALIATRTGEPYDAGGARAAQGRVDGAALRALLDLPYFAQAGPKSLDRWDFSLGPVEHLTLEDALATLAAFTAETVRLGFARLAERPARIIACGGGRKNAHLMARLAGACEVAVQPAETVGWRGDFIEAEAFAFLAARSARGLWLSDPAVTGARQAVTGGRRACA